MGVESSDEPSLEEPIVPQTILEITTSQSSPEHPPMNGHIQVWKMVHQPIIEIPFFYPPPRVSAY